MMIKKKYNVTVEATLEVIGGSGNVSSFVI